VIPIVAAIPSILSIAGPLIKKYGPTILGAAVKHAPVIGKAIGVAKKAVPIASTAIAGLQGIRAVNQARHGGGGGGNMGGADFIKNMKGDSGAGAGALLSTLLARREQQEAQTKSMNNNAIGQAIKKASDHASSFARDIKPKEHTEAFKQGTQNNQNDSILDKIAELQSGSSSGGQSGTLANAFMELLKHKLEV
jgi:hypothetical protein